MKIPIKLILMISLPIIGVITGYLLMARVVEARVDGESFTVRTRALTVGGALRSAGYRVAEGDSVTPPAQSWLSKTDVIQLDRARLVRVYDVPEKELVEIKTSALTAFEILEQAGFTPDAHDSVILNGLAVGLSDKLPQSGAMALVYRPAVMITLKLDGGEQKFVTSAANLGDALWEAGIRLRAGDWVTPALDTPLVENIEVELRAARALTIQVDGTTIKGYSAAPTTSQALAESGVTLQDQDYSQPAADEPPPEDGLIQVVRVTEETLSQQRLIPFETESLADNTMFTNEKRVVQTGVNGLAAARVKVRYEDGVEVARETQGEVLLSNPLAQIEYYGTKLLENYIDTPEGPLQYYLAVDAVATSFAPCHLGVEGLCSNITASGRILQKGIVAFKRDWFNIFRDTRVYVPGYGIGIVGDKGTYPYSDRWIDLGYSDADYVPWGAVKVTIYFLSPPPSGFTGVLP